MKTTALTLVIFLILISGRTQSQIKSLIDSEYKRFDIGFQIFIPANDRTKIVISNKDRTVEYVIFDSTLARSDTLYFIFAGYSEKEKNNYTEKKLYSIPISDSGIYFLEYTTRQKFVLIK